VAIAMRAALFPQMPWLSNDAYRYVWDGRVQTSGVNPYRYIPADEALAPLRDDAIYPGINRREYAKTIYPPAAQALFLLAALFGSSSVYAVKALFLALDLLTLGGLMVLLRRANLDVNRIILYAWNPLVVWEVAHSAHVDAAVALFLTLALLARCARNDVGVGVALGLAALTKFYPAVVAPALYRRWDWKMPLAFAATCVLGYLPYASVGREALGFLPSYAQEEGLDTGQRFFPLVLLRLVGPVSNSVYLVGATLVLAAAAALVVVRSRDGDTVEVLGRRAGVLLGLALLVLCPGYAWYFLPLAALLVLHASPAWLLATIACVVLYAAGFPATFPTGRFGPAVLLYPPVYALLAAETARWLWRHKRSAADSAVSCTAPLRARATARRWWSGPQA
jgi:hypothetical protein